MSEIKSDKNGDGELDHLGKKVTVAGKANVSSSIFDTPGKTVFIQDHSAAIRLFFPNLLHKSVNINKSDSLIVTGKLKLYYGKPEIVVENYRIEKAVSPLPSPVPLRC